MKLKNTFIISLILPSILIFSGCIKVNDSVSSNIDTNCEELVKPLIPHYFSIESEIPTILAPLTWTDGTRIDLLHYLRKGNLQGENANYFYGYYPLSDTFEGDPAEYNKQIISKDGTILGDRKFKVKLIFKRIQPSLTVSGDMPDIDSYSNLEYPEEFDALQKYDVYARNSSLKLRVDSGSTKIQYVEVVSTKIVSCNWIDEK